MRNEIFGGHVKKSHIMPVLFMEISGCHIGVKGIYMCAKGGLT